MEAADVARRLAALAPESAPQDERKLPRIIKAGMVVRGGDVAPEPRSLEPPAPIYPEGYIPPEEAHRLTQLLLSEAHEAASRILVEAREQGRQEGLAAGMAAGQQAALDSWSALIEGFKQQLEAAVGLRQQLLAAAEPDIVRLVLLAVSKVVQREARLPDLAADLVRRTLPRASEGTVVKVRVNPADHSRLQAAPAVPPGHATYDLVADPAVGQGGCLVETTLCTVDATFRLMFEEVARELLQDEPGSDPVVAAEMAALAARDPEL